MARRAILCVIGAFVLFAVGSCSSGSGDDVPSELSDATAVIEQALHNMEALNSYEQEFAFWPNGYRVPFVVEYQDPADYHEYMLERDEARDTEELILLGDQSFGRYCKKRPDDCEGWKVAEREFSDPPGAFHLTTTMPETWGLVAVETAESVKVMELEGGEDPLLRIAGQVNILRTTYVNHSRIYGSERIVDVDDGFTLEEYYEAYHGGTEFKDVPTERIDIWLGADDLLVHRIIVEVSGREHPYLETRYSRFNEVTIEAPENAVPAD
jgi:hypothetical protein